MTAAISMASNQLRSIHHLLQSLRSLAAGWRVEPCHKRPCRCSRRGCADDRHFHCPRASARSVHQHGACITRNQRQSMGRSRGGLTSKIHALVDSNGLPVRLALSPGEAHDTRLARKLLSRLKSGSTLLADRGYDADWIRELAMKKGAWANIPPKSNRNGPICFSPYLYRLATRSSGSSIGSSNVVGSRRVTTSLPPTT
jgi:transposase